MNRFRPGIVFAGVTIGFTVIQFLRETDRDNKTSWEDTKMVEAWKNPTTGQWETPAPWNPMYRKLKPELHLVPRKDVKQGSRR